MTTGPTEPTDPEPPPPPPPPPPGPAPRRLMRVREGRMVGGVSMGLAEHLDADPTLIRLAWVVLTFITGGLFAVLYLAMWVLVPEEGDLARGGDATTSGWRQEPRERSAWGGVVWGLILVAIGVIALLSQLDVPMPSWRAVVAAALVLAGLGIVATARRGVNGGLVVLAVLLAALLATGRGLPVADVDSAFGERRLTVSGPADLEPHYGHAFGGLRIDIAPGALPDGTTSMEASVAFGSLRVTVPDDVGVRVRASTAFGSARVLDEELGAFGRQGMTTPGYEQAAKRLDLTVNTAFGSTRISRGQP